MNKILTALSIALYLFSVSIGQTKDFAKWVNPFIGTGGHGHTFPGATMPFGMVQLSPDTRIDNWDGSSGYHYSDDIIYGFSHTHLSGTGIPDGCDILFVPMTEYSLEAKAGDKDVNGYASLFSHANEKAEPGYYSVKLDDDNIRAELTATTRVGLHRYTFPKSDDIKILLDLKWRDKVLDSEVTVVRKNRIEGYRRSSSWAKDQIIYFVAEFSKPFRNSLTGSGKVFNSLHSRSGDVKAVLYFGPTKGEQILLKVALSPVSIEGARANLKAELPGWDFDKVRADAKAAWNKELSKIEVSGGTDDQTTTFYTALYHTMIQPNVFNDVDGKYPGLDKKVHQLPGYPAVPLAERRSSASPTVAISDSGYAAGFGERRQSRDSIIGPDRKSIAFPLGEGQSPENPQSQNQRPKTENQYTVFSLWDTFRAAHPLYTIIDQKRTVDFINTFIRQYEDGGRLPVWELWGEETDTMIGYHAVSVIADAMAKGIKGFDYEKAYAAAKHSAELDHFGLAAYKKRGYISMEDEQESVSKTLEYAYDDWCIAQMAKTLVDQKQAEWHFDSAGAVNENPQQHKLIGEYRHYLTRSGYFENLFDLETRFFRPKQNGGFVKPFAPNEVTFHFTEGNSWQYSFFVPHDIYRLIELMSGSDKFAAKLDELFTTDAKLAGREQPDITGLIGQYAHGNEPSHHIAYLYNYARQPWKTQKLVRRIMDEFYKPTPDGLIGNEDCGQMSAWYILSASGFYPVTPGSPKYTFGTPLFKKIKYNLENGKTFTIKAPDVSEKSIYIKSVKLNKVSYPDHDFSHWQIAEGGSLEFEMTDAPAGPIFRALPSFAIQNNSMVAVPVIDGGARVFDRQTRVALKSTTPNSTIFYTLDGTEPKVNAKMLYSAPFTIDRTSTVKAFAVTNVSLSHSSKQSRTAEATFIKKPNDWTVKITSKYSRQYNGGGDEGLIDGIRGTVNFASGEWQGYQGQDFVATVDLQKETEINKVGGGFLQVARSWIWMPTHVEFETSTDGVNFTRVADIKTDLSPEDMESKMRDYLQAISPVKARYVRVKAYNLGKIPPWHPGAGSDAFIFVDEILLGTQPPSPATPVPPA